MANTAYLRANGLGNFHKTNLDNNSSIDTNLIYQPDMNQFLETQLQSNKMEIELFDTSKAIYNLCKNNLLTYCTKTRLSNYDDFDNFVINQMLLTNKQVEKNTIALYLSNFKSASIFFDKNEEQIVIASTMIKNQKQEFLARQKGEKMNTRFLFQQTAKHTVVGRIISNAPLIVTTVSTFGIAGCKFCAWVGIYGCISCGAVGGVIGGSCRYV